MIALERRQNVPPTTTFSSSSTPSSSQSSSAGSVSVSVPISSVSVVTTSTPSSTSSEATRPAFPTDTVTPPTQQTSDRDRTNQTAKTILEWLFLGFALLLLAAIALRRLNKLRNDGIPLSQFFHRNNRYRRARSRGLLSSPVTTEISPRERRLPRTTGLPALSPTTASAPYHLAEIPVARLSGDRHGNDRYAHQINHLLYGPARRARTRAADIDRGGRRGVGEQGVERDYGGDDEDDEDGGLPAYDKHGGPPVYVEVLGIRAAHTQRSREGPVTESTDNHRGNGESSDMPPRAEPPSYPGHPVPQPAENPFSAQEERTTRAAAPPRLPPRSQRSLRPSSSSMMPGSLSNW
ncbi:hypothetical protein AAF712_015696 [Marasmius tenuissimus]|uniref:Uncharacterized protein n=1 Tax=Marasmius tenuissimus TaxID=585030 RepID=A0ABR2Z8I8_9AGAR